MNKSFRIGCLSTTTGRWHGDKVAALVKPAGYETEILPFESSAELDNALLSNSIDLAVCRASQLSLELSEELELIAFTERQTVNDVAVSRSKETLLTTPNLKVGVSSQLKSAFMNHFYSSADVVLEQDSAKCIANLEVGIFESLVVDTDEILPQNFDAFAFEPIETSYFVPAAGQGSISVRCHRKLNFSHKEILHRWVNNEETEDCIRAERSFLKSLPDTENMLPFSYAHFEGALITLKAGIISTDGKEIFKTKKSAALGESKELGKKVALEVIKLFSEQRMQVL